MKEFKR